MYADHVDPHSIDFYSYKLSVYIIYWHIVSTYINKYGSRNYLKVVSWATALNNSYWNKNISVIMILHAYCLKLSPADPFKGCK